MRNLRLVRHSTRWPNIVRGSIQPFKCSPPRIRYPPT